MAIVGRAKYPRARENRLPRGDGSRRGRVRISPAIAKMIDKSATWNQFFAVE